MDKAKGIYECSWGRHEYKLYKPGVVRCIHCGKFKS